MYQTAAAGIFRNLETRLAEKRQYMYVSGTELTKLLRQCRRVVHARQLQRIEEILKEKDGLRRHFSLLTQSFKVLQTLRLQTSRLM